MNGLCGVQWGVFTLGGGNGKLLREWVVWNPIGGFHTGDDNGNGKTVVMEIIAEWVGYPFAMAMAMATHLIALHFAIAAAADTPQ